MSQYKNSQQYGILRFQGLICLATSTLALLASDARCQAFSRTANLEQLRSVSSPYATLVPANPVVAQGFDPPGASPSNEVSPAHIDIPGLPLPVSEFLRDLGSGGSSRSGLPDEAPPPPDQGSPAGGDESPAVGIPAPPPFSLKDVRQSVEIALPSEQEMLSLTELPFNKMHPNVISQADPNVDGRWVDFYQFNGEANQQIIVMLRNSDDARQNGLPLSPYMVVFDPTGKVMAGTIIPGQYRIPTADPLLPLDNQLALKLPQSGRYIVAVFTDPGVVGRYGIGWKQDETRYRHDEIHELTDIESLPTEITGRAGQVVQIQAMSYQFDPVVQLVDANGNVIEQDDDDGGNYNARIDVALPADGVYRAIVTSANGQGRGEYRLRLR